MNQLVRKSISFILSGVLVISLFSAVECADAKAVLKTKKLAMYVGQKAAIKLKKKNTKNTYLFKSNRNEVVKANKKGKVTAIKKGTAKIIVSEKVKATKKIRTIGVCKVVVLNKPINEYVPTPSPVVDSTVAPTVEPTQIPVTEPTQAPTEVPTQAPTAEPTMLPTQ